MVHFPDISVSQVESNLPGEDRFCVRATPDVFAAAVYDGHGGYLAADIACAILLDLIVSAVQRETDDTTSNARVAECIDAAFQQCDDHILKQAVTLHRKQVRSFAIAQLKEGADGTTSTSVGASSSSSSNSNGSSNASSSSSNGNSSSANNNSSAASAAASAAAPKMMGRAGTCAVVVVVVRGVVFTAHVGDCRALLVRDAAPPLGAPPATATNAAFSSPGGSAGPGAVVASSTAASSATAGVSANDGDAEQFVIVDPFLASLASVTEAVSSTTSPGDGHDRAGFNGLMLHRTTRLSKAPVRPDVGVDFCATRHGLTAARLTLDHACDVPAEAEGVRSLTSDPNPVRASDNDRKALGARAPLRVAGSLAVTRALGDPYLKNKELSMPVFADHLPYITGRPTISYRALLPTDRAIVLASDGLWNFIRAVDCCDVLARFLAVDVMKPPNDAASRTPTKTTTNSAAAAAAQDSNGSDTMSGRKRKGRGTDSGDGSVDGGRGDGTEERLRRRLTSSEDTENGAPPQVSRVAWRSQGMQPFFFSLDSHVPTGPLNYCTGFAPLATATANAVLQFAPEDDAGVDTGGAVAGHHARDNVKAALGVGGAHGPVSLVRLASTVKRASTAPGVGDGAVEVSHVVKQHGGTFQVQIKAAVAAAEAGTSAAAAAAGAETEADTGACDNRKIEDVPNATALTGVAAALCESDLKAPTPGTDAVMPVEQDDSVVPVEGSLTFDYYSEPPAAGTTTCATPGQAPVQQVKVEAPVEAPTTHVRLHVDLNDGPAEALMDRCLHHAAINSVSSVRGLTGAKLKKLRQGALRRSLVDDITVLVLTFPRLCGDRGTVKNQVVG